MWRRLDLLPIVPQDFSQKTNTGGCFTLLMVFSLSWFLIAEIMDFAKTEIVSNMQVEEPGKKSQLLDRLVIQFNVTFPNCSCHVLSVETIDMLGGFASDHLDDLYADKQDDDNVEYLNDEKIANRHQRDRKKH